MKILWHKKARLDLDLHIKYIAERSPQNAKIVLNELLDLVDSFVVFPYKYPKEPIYNQENIRFTVKWSYKIIYRVDEDNLYVLRIISTHQNPDTVFA